MSITSNIADVQQQIADACKRALRPESDVALMAVSKMHPAEALREAHAAGLRLFGENRVQEWQEKSATLRDIFVAAQENDCARMHLIGPLQSNKTTRAAELFDSIDSIDSLKIAVRLNNARKAINKKLPILIEVKLSDEESKHGVLPEDLPALLTDLKPLDFLAPSGLMTVPPWSQDPEPARPYFRELRRLRDDSLAACPTLAQLSMGMSNDFRVAIEEGSTCIRVGTAIFGKRLYPTPIEVEK